MSRAAIVVLPLPPLPAIAIVVVISQSVAVSKTVEGVEGRVYSCLPLLSYKL
jgi:hypothetical protein